MNLYTPEQVTERYPLIKTGWLKRLAREGRIEHTRLERRRIAFTEAQVAAVIDMHAAKTSAPVPANRLTTARSRRRTA